MDRLGAASTDAEESGAPVLSLVKIGPALRVWRAWMAGSAEMVASRKGLGNSGGEASQRLQSPQRPSPTALQMVSAVHLAFVALPCRARADT